MWHLATLLFFLDEAVESVFDLNFSSPFHQQADLMPLAAMLFPQLENFVLFLRGPLVPAHVRIDDIDPALAALPGFPLAALADSLIELLGDARPLFRLAGSVTVLHALRGDLFGDFSEDFGFTGRPGRLLPLDVLDEQPPLLALARGATWHQVGHSLPVSI